MNTIHKYELAPDANSEPYAVQQELEVAQQRIAELEAAGLAVVLQCGGLLSGSPITRNLLDAVGRIARVLR